MINKVKFPMNPQLIVRWSIEWVNVNLVYDFFFFCRSHMMSSSLKLWDDIHRHMVFLVRRGVMEPEGVAFKFAPLLLAAHSQANEKVDNIQLMIILNLDLYSL